jgi:hypothetical protein
MAPEQVNGPPVTRAADVYAAGVVLWEALTGATLFSGDSDVALAAQVLLGNVAAPSRSVPGVPPVFDDITMCALERDPARRFATARDMARALETSVPLASASQVAVWVENLAGPVLRRREQRLWEIERDWAARTGAVERTSSGLPAQQGAGAWAGDARRDASTGAVTYAAGMEAGTRVEGMRRGAQDASNLLDTQDHPPPPRAHAGLPLGIWVALAAGATIAAAGVVDRRGDLVGLLHHTPTATSVGSVTPGPSPGPGPSTASPPPATAPATTPAPPGVTASPAPVTVSVESLPVAEPSTISIDALPRAPGPVPSGPATRRARPRHH